MPAILFGSIGTLADTSERQREAFNRAFAEHGLDWHWDQDDYRAMLERSGGANRVAEYAESRGETVDAAAVHRSKSEIFRRSLAESPLPPRRGVVETIKQARSAGVGVALVTTTSQENISSLIESLQPDIRASDFDLIVDATSVQQPKPDQAAYAFALDRLGADAGDCVAVEDNVGGVEAAATAGVTCVAFPGENNAGHDFPRATRQTDQLDFAELRELIHGS